MDAATGSLTMCAELMAFGEQLQLGPYLQEPRQCIRELQAAAGGAPAELFSVWQLAHALFCRCIACFGLYECR